MCSKLDVSWPACFVEKISWPLPLVQSTAIFDLLRSQPAIWLPGNATLILLLSARDDNNPLGSLSPSSQALFIPSQEAEKFRKLRTSRSISRLYVNEPCLKWRDLFGKNLFSSY
jgi:hypothetical protein